MSEHSNQEAVRLLTPLSELGYDISNIEGVQEGTLHLTPALIEQFNTQPQSLMQDPHIPLSAIYDAKEVLYGKNAEPCRYVYTPEHVVSDGGNGTIVQAYDRLKGVKGIAKIVPYYAKGDDRDQFNMIFQREAELMTILQTDRLMKEHMVEVWDVAYVQMSGKDMVLIFEEYMNPELQPMLINANQIDKLSGQERIKLVEQLCVLIDQMAEHNVFHYDLSDKNIFIDLKTMKLKLSDFGTANKVYDVKTHGLEATPAWVSPEREWYNGEEKEPGLQSEVYTLTALAYYILSDRKIPYNTNHWPTQRGEYYSRAGDYLTHFSPKAKETLLDNAKKLSLTQEQINNMFDVFEKGLAIKPEHRYQNGHQLFHELVGAIYPESQLIGFWKESKP